MRFVFVALFLSAVTAFGEERILMNDGSEPSPVQDAPGVGPSSENVRLSMRDNSDSILVKDVVRKAVQFFDVEDLDSYESCFRTSRRSHLRRKVARIFAAEECSMSIVDIHIIDIDESEASVALKYSVAGSSFSFEVLSEVRLVKEHDSWAIDREIVRSKSQTPTNSAPKYPALVSGQAPEWDPMNPDPNKIPAEIHHLMGDVGIREGFGCVGGRCANGRCPR